MADEEIIDRSPPMALFQSGEAFRLSARHLDAAIEAGALRLPFEMPIYLLYSHALELCLQSFLRAKGVPAGELAEGKMLGHGLRRLHRACLERGLVLKPVPHARIEGVVEMLDALARKQEFRNLTSGFDWYSVLSEAGAACDMLFEAVKPIVAAAVNDPIVERPWGSTPAR